MKRLLLIALAAIGMVACNSSAESLGTGYAEFDELLQNSVVDSYKLIDDLTSQGATIIDHIQWDEAKNEWVKHHIAGAINSLAALLFRDDMSYEAMIWLPNSPNALSEYEVVSREYDFNGSTFSFDTKKNVIYTLNTETQQECSAEVLYYNDGIVILDGTIYVGEDPSLTKFNNVRHKIKLQLSEQQRTIIEERKAMVDDPNIEVERLIASQQGEIDDELVAKQLTELGFTFLLEMRYDDATDRWSDLLDNSSDKRHAVLMFDDATAACLKNDGLQRISYRYDAETNTLYTASDGKEYAATILFCNDERMVFDGEMAIYEGKAAERYRAICWFNGIAKSNITTYIDSMK